MHWALRLGLLLLALLELHSLPQISPVNRRLASLARNVREFGLGVKDRLTIFS